MSSQPFEQVASDNDCSDSSNDNNHRSEYSDGEDSSSAPSSAYDGHEEYKPSWSEGLGSQQIKHRIDNDSMCSLNVGIDPQTMSLLSDSGFTEDMEHEHNNIEERAVPHLRSATTPLVARFDKRGDLYLCLPNGDKAMGAELNRPSDQAHPSAFQVKSPQLETKSVGDELPEPCKTEAINGGALEHHEAVIVDAEVPAEIKTRRGSNTSVRPKASIESHRQVSPGSCKRWIMACYGPRFDKTSTSNVERLVKAINPRTCDGIHQITVPHFVPGFWDGFPNEQSVIEGVADVIYAVYSSLSINCGPGDEIVLIGFSGGAFVADCVAAMIDVFGLQADARDQRMGSLFGERMHRGRDGKKQDRTSKEPLSTGCGVRIKAIAVWDMVHLPDTVSSDIMGRVLQTFGFSGQPLAGMVSRLRKTFLLKEETRLSHYSRLPACVDNAFHALALDERAPALTPILWYQPSTTDSSSSHATLQQVWFPGMHATFGGAYNDQKLANLSLVWMAGQLEPLLDIDLDQIHKMCASDDSGNYQQWCLGPMPKPGVYAPRSPGYLCPHGKTGEYVHNSVHVRTKAHTKHQEDRSSSSGGDGSRHRNPKYAPAALADWAIKRSPRRHRTDDDASQQQPPPSRPSTSASTGAPSFLSRPDGSTRVHYWRRHADARDNNSYACRLLEAQLNPFEKQQQQQAPPDQSLCTDLIQRLDSALGELGELGRSHSNATKGSRRRTAHRDDTHAERDPGRDGERSRRRTRSSRSGRVVSVSERDRARSVTG